MNISLLDLISDVSESAKAGGVDRAIALDFAAAAIQRTDDTMPWLVARRIAASLLPVSQGSKAAA